MPLDSYLDAEPLVLLKVDGSMVQGNYRQYSLNSMDVKLPAGLLEPWDWGTTKIHQESMRAERRKDSVQGFTFDKIAHLSNPATLASTRFREEAHWKKTPGSDHARPVIDFQS